MSKGRWQRGRERSAVTRREHAKLPMYHSSRLEYFPDLVVASLPIRSMAGSLDGAEKRGSRSALGSEAMPRVDDSEQGGAY